MSAVKSASMLNVTAGMVELLKLMRSAMTLRMGERGIRTSWTEGAAAAAEAAITSSFMIRPSLEMEETSTPISAASFAAAGLVFTLDAPPAAAKESTSFRTILPPGPVPGTREMSIPPALAVFLARGVARTPAGVGERSFASPDGRSSAAFSRTAGAETEEAWPPTASPAFPM